VTGRVVVPVDRGVPAVDVVPDALVGDPPAAVVSLDAAPSAGDLPALAWFGGGEPVGRAVEG
jgi:hypothetical protein